MRDRKLKWPRVGLAVLPVVVAGSMAVTLRAPTAYAATTSVINGAVSYQRMEGFGFSEAFQRSNYLHGSLGLSATKQKDVLDLLFSPTTGAGFTILRNGIGSSPNNSNDWMQALEPKSPGSPNATPTYVWDGNDNSQVWLSQQAMNYGVKTIYADAWSAPGFMKSNGTDTGGGMLCGVPGASCASGDWRRAYANMLTKYVQLYAQAGVPVTHLGFLNEPDLTTSYASMQSNGAQAADFIKVLGPTLASAGLSTKIVCCETTGWPVGNDMINQIAADSTALSKLDVLSGHGYSGAPSFPFAQASKPSWQTEWSTFDGWNTSWDDGGGASGLTWASNIMTGLTAANLNAFLYWWGADEKDDNEALIRLSGDSYAVSARLWAFANYSRYIRPGAVRIGATSGDNNLKLAAFTNADGSIAVVALNNSRSATQTSFSLTNAGISTGFATPHLTDATHNAATQQAIGISGGSFNATLPARSLVTYTIPAGGGDPTSPPPSSSAPTPPSSPSVPPSSPPTTTCRVSDSVNAWNSGLTESITITNTGNGTINGWSLAFTLPGGQTITNGWNAGYAPTSGQVTATNATWNGTLATGASTSIGFQATHTGNSAAATGFTLNGSPCATG